MENRCVVMQLKVPKKMARTNASMSVHVALLWTDGEVKDVKRLIVHFETFM